MGLLESRTKLHTEYFNNLDDVVKANSQIQNVPYTLIFAQSSSGYKIKSFI